MAAPNRLRPVFFFSLAFVAPQLHAEPGAPESAVLQPGALEPAVLQPGALEPAVPEPAVPALEPATPAEAEEHGQEIRVLGTRLAHTAGSVHVIGEAQLERFEYDDPAAVLLQVPGVYVRNEDGVGLRPNIGIRGTNPDRSKKLTLLEDGVLFGPAPYSAPAAYFFPLVTRMTAVRVIKGPGAVAYGPQTVGGAVDFVTRPIPSETSGALDVALGEYGYNKVHGHFGASTERFGFLVEGVRLGNTGFKELPDRDADTGSTRDEWMAKFWYAFDPISNVQNDLELKLSYYDETSNETYLGLTDADFRDNPDRRYAASALDRMKSHRTSIVLKHALAVGHFKLTTQLYRNDFARVWRKANRFGGAGLFEVLTSDNLPQEYRDVLSGASDSATGSETLYVGPNDRTFVSQGVQSVADYSTSTGPFTHEIRGGVRLHYDEIIRRHSESGFSMTDGRLVPDGQPPIVTAANRGSTLALALHALDNISYGRLTLSPGLRVEVLHGKDRNELVIDGATTTNNLVAVLPGVGLYAGVTDQVGLLLGVHRGFSPPAPGKKDVEPEYSVNYEAGARYTRGRARAEVIGFYNDYSNLTNTCSLASGCTEQNLDRQFDAGKARIYGTEVFVGHDWPAGPVVLPLFASYTFTRAEFATNFRSEDPIYGNVSAGDQIPYIPRHQLVVSAGAEAGIAGGSFAVNYISPMREEPGTGALSNALATDEQIWADLNLYVRPLSFLSIYANARNLFDARNIVSRRPYGARPNAPRWIQVGARAEF